MQEVQKLTVSHSGKNLAPKSWPLPRDFCHFLSHQAGVNNLSAYFSAQPGISGGHPQPTILQGRKVARPSLIFLTPRPFFVLLRPTESGNAGFHKNISFKKYFIRSGGTNKAVFQSHS